jgi:hypothetical protein
MSSVTAAVEFDEFGHRLAGVVDARTRNSPGRI